MFAKVILAIGRVPLLGPLLRRIAGGYAEGSVTPIRGGLAKGCLWRRRHADVNGYWLGIYEPDMQAALAREIKPGYVFYDIGANVGFFTLLAARLVGVGGHVYAFEPLPENAEVLAGQIALNKLNHVDAVRSAVGAASGEARFSRFSHAATGRLADQADGVGEMISVPIVALDEFVAAHVPPQVIKMDVEGSEVDALKGATTLLRVSRPVFLIELHGPDKATGVAQILTLAGYTFTDLQGHSIADIRTAPHVVARPATRAGA